MNNFTDKRLMDAYDDTPSGGAWDSDKRNKWNLTQEETFKRLDKMDIEYIETYLRKKKIKKIKKDLDI